jgi:hypothetical protein
VIERNRSDCKYVEIFTYRVGSIGAPSRRTVFIRGTNTKQWEIPKIAIIIIIQIIIIIINVYKKYSYATEYGANKTRKNFRNSWSLSKHGLKMNEG